MPIDKSIDYSAITPEIKALTKLCLADNVIEPEMYVKYAVNRGLRDLNGNGVLTGLTEISEIQSSKMVDGRPAGALRRQAVLPRRGCGADRIGIYPRKAVRL